MGAHSPFTIRPSFAPVWGHCSAAILASSQSPNLETDESREGDAAHWLGALVLGAYRDAGNGQGPAADTFLGQAAPNGVVIDDKIVQGVQVYVDEVVLVAGKQVGRLMVEYVVPIPTVHAENGGSLDCALYLPERSVLFLWDYKNGHAPVDPVDNFQFIEYAEGLRLDREIELDINLVIRVVQPFCYNNDGPIAEWACKFSDIRGAVNVLHAKAHESQTNPLMSAGKHCRYCPALADCSAARRATYSYVDEMNKRFEIDKMSLQDLTVERGILTAGAVLIKARLAAIEDDLKHRIGAGQFGSGLTLESSYGNLEWTIPDEQAAALATQFGFDINKPGVKTPTQAQDEAPKAIRAQFKQVVKGVTKRPPRGLKLINASDSKTARAFSKKQ